MPGTDAQKKPISQGVIARLTQGVRFMISGKAPDSWFGPSQPLQPQAQTDASNRQFDYPVAINTVWTPKGEGSETGISFGQLRTLADASDLVRLAIETRKDQMGRLEWLIAPRDQTKDASGDPRVQQLTDFLQSPDKEHDWSTWLRMLLEDCLVLDAATVYPRATRGGGVYSLDLMDGSMFKRLIGNDGRMPIAPDPAYQQVIKGMPAVNYSRDELLYIPRNPRTNRLYGYSPVEQIIVTVNILLRRQLHKLQYYTEGSAPDLMLAVPENWNPDQIKQMQNYFDALLAGNTAERRKTRFIPGGMEPFNVKEGALKDDYDEWLARVVCYAFSLPPTAFVKQMNRATAQNAQDVALEEGLAPIMQWTTNLMNQVIARWFQWPDLCFTWQQDAELDQLTQAQIDLIYLQNKVVTPDEVREEIGMEPLTPEQDAKLNPPPPPGLDPNNPANQGGNGDDDNFGGSNAQKIAARAHLKKKAYRGSTAIARQSRSRAKRYAKY